MIVNDGQQIVSNITDLQEFSITHDSARLFRMLSDFLYSNKEMCVLHEISSNALDAHKLAGKENEPIHVYAPTEINSSLRIRDFGPGLSEQDVRKLLTTYGESGSYKRTSNDYIGSWGIGSKSPASVTKTWDIRSHHNGMNKLYKVFINERGIPTITKLTTTPTDETGIEVSIPIEPSKHRIWTELFSAVYQYYPVTPKFFGSTPSIVKPTSIYQTNNWGIYKQSVYGSCSIIIANRRYTIKPDEVLQFLKSRLTPAENIAAHEILASGNIQLFFDVGELELSISRETIQYTKHTINAFETRIREVISNLKDIFIAEVDSNKVSQIDYKVSLADYIDKYTGGRFLRMIKMFVDETGNPYHIDSNVDLNHITLKLNILGVLVRRLKHISGVKSISLRGMYTPFSFVKDTDYVNIAIGAIRSKSFSFVVKDVFNTSARVRNQKRLGLILNALIIDPKEVKRIPKELRGFVIGASNLPQPPREARSSDNSSQVDNYKDWYHLDPRGGGTFMFKPILRDDLEALSNRTDLVYVNFRKARQSSTVKADPKVIYLGTPVIGVRDGCPPPKNAKHLDQFLADIVIDAQSDYEDLCRYVWFLNTSQSLRETIKRHVKDIDSDSFIRTEFEKFSSMSADKKTLYSMYNRFNTVDMTKYSSIFDKYPMLKYIRYSDELKRDDFLSYVNLVDKELKNAKV